MITAWAEKLTGRAKGLGRIRWNSRRLALSAERRTWSEVLRGIAVRQWLRAPGWRNYGGAPRDDPETQPLRWVPRAKPQPASSTAEKPAGDRMRRLATVACVLAVIGLAVGGFGLVEALSAHQDENSLRAQLTTLKQRVIETQGEVKQVASQVTTIPGRAPMAAVQGQLASEGSTLSKLQNESALYSNCIPEIQTELNGLSINWSINASDVGASTFNISNNSQTSRDCSKLLYGG